MANNNGKRTLEEFGDDDISDELVTMIGKLYDDFDAPDSVLDEELIELGEQMDSESTPLFEFDFQPVGQPKKALKSVNKQRAKFTVAEIYNDTTRFEGYMQTLANQLNSNESFNVDDEFQVDMTIISEPDAGSRTALSILGKLNMTTVLRRKRCVLPIENSEDNFCLAKAICLTKAHLHKDEDKDGYNKFHNLKNNPSVLTRCAKFLHREARVPEGACGREELQKFQEYLAPDYRLKVMSVRYPYSITFEGKVTAPKVIRALFQSDPEGRIGHYHGCNSYSGFLERSYFCDECNRGFDHDEFSHQACQGRRCSACKTIECGPKQHYPTLHCTHCNRHFYDNSCMSLHRDKGLCASWIRCGICCKKFKPSKKEPHRCDWSECRNCKEDVDLSTHQCYIQPVNPNEDKPKKKSKSILKRQRKNNPDVSEYCEPPIKVWADFEAMLDEDSTHIPILIVAETSESNEVFEFYCPECTGDFPAFLDELAYGPPEENRHWDD
ncbi:hypothetical protein AWC38_SpisGene10311 [Stylophora pistillata]|uniref:Uncharacterized protein n=1 Tax=Stylophora pistillata TaxID=50429 RepID=A0A2B4S956_STYPI|nr:hypothetical protein AWC38_SpisGene10311 [Stylophora pistillata]